MKYPKPGFLTIAVAVSAMGLAQLSLTSYAQTTANSDANATTRVVAADESIRPFRASFPDSAITELRQRIAATRWPDRETVSDRSQGAQLAKIQELVHYWGADYDWRKTEAKLNAHPQFVTRIDGLDIHFIHVKSRHPNAMPLIVTHGWPGSVFELLKTIGPLTDPAVYGGRAEDAFDVVMPSMPGYGLSGTPTAAGWGAVVAQAQGRQAPQGLLGIHVNMPATVPANIAKALKSGAPAPASLTGDVKTAYNSMNKLYTQGGGNAGVMVTRPQTLGYSLSDSPVGQAAWFYDKFAD